MLADRKITVLAAVLAAVVSTLAAAEEPVPMGREAAEEFLSGVVEARKGFTTLAAEFTDTKESFILMDKTVAKGYLRVRKPDSIRRDITEPTRSLVSLVGQKGWFCQPGKAPQQIDLAKSKGQNVAGVIFKLLVGDSFQLTELEKRFKVKTFSIGEDLLIELKPKEADLAESVTLIAITFAPKAIWPKRVGWEKAGGDSYLDEFTNVVVDPEIPESVFKPPVNWREKLPLERPAPREE